MGKSWLCFDRQRSTYWCTTGSYPQAFILSFPNLIYISSVKIRSYLVQLITVEKSVAETAQRFEEVCDKELELTDHCHQVESLHSSTFSARHLRFTIQSGYDHICAVYRVEVQGSFKKLNDGYKTESSPSPINIKDKPLKFNTYESPRSIQKESPMWIEEDDEKDEAASPLGAINHSTSLMSLHSSEEDERN
ncbi:hypothetical protein C0J52_02505 [Blattella germanica]|nr:hypothetical protein C0J52_02505 [Blattella germanica]